MFTVHCQTCGVTRLYGPRRITGLVNTVRGILVRVTCFCGAEATTVTGRSTPAAGADPAELVSSAA